MDRINLYKKPISFRSRCVEIRDAQWVCHKVNTEMPHFSITKFKPLIIKQMNLLERHHKQLRKTSILTDCLWDNLTALGLNSEDLAQLGFLQRIIMKYKQKFVYTQKDKDVSRILNRAKDKIKNFYQKRNECHQSESDINNSLMLIEKYKFGNCKETANLAELILKINGIKNAITVILKAEKENVTLDHAVCVFNRDGSPFLEIKKDTIVIDPWVDKADFAGNIIKFYKNQFKYFFRIPEKQKITFFCYKNCGLGEMDILKFRKKYPNLLFNNTKRKFMKQEIIK